jgi:hypothetical protein
MNEGQSSSKVFHQHQIFGKGIHLCEQQCSLIRGQVEAMPGVSIES